MGYPAYNHVMLSEQIQKEIAAAHKLRNDLEAMVYKRGECKPDERGIQLLAYWSLILDLHCAVLSLLSQGLFGAAFALVRCVVEINIRSHMVLFCSPDELLKIQQDEYRVNFKDVGPKIDQAFGFGTFMQDFLTDATKALHSYTHGGSLQVQRRFDGNDLKPRYRDGEITEVINTTTSAMFMATNLVTKHFGFEDEWKRGTAMVLEWGKH